MAERSRDFRVERFEDVTIVRLTTDMIDSLNYEPLGLALLDLVDRKQVVKLLINLEHVEFLFSFALGQFAAVQRKLHSAGGGLGFCGLQPSVRQIFAATQFEQLVQVWRSEQAALKDWAADDELPTTAL